MELSYNHIVAILYVRTFAIEISFCCFAIVRGFTNTFVWTHPVNLATDNFEKHKNFKLSTGVWFVQIFLFEFERSPPGILWI